MEYDRMRAFFHEAMSRLVIGAGDIFAVRGIERENHLLGQFFAQTPNFRERN